MKERTAGRLFLKARWILPIADSPVENGCVELAGDRIVGVHAKVPEGVLAAVSSCGKAQVSENSSGQSRACRASEFAPETSWPTLQNDYDSETDTVIDFGNAIIMPGLINLHAHVEYTRLRGFDTDSNLFEWIPGLMGHARKWSPEQWRQSARMGADELLRTGTTCVVDSSFTGQAAVALAERGIRGIVGLELFGVDESRVDQFWTGWLTKREQLLESIWQGSSEDAGLAKAKAAIESGSLKISVAPHAPYTVCPSLMRKALDWAAEFDLPTTTHLAESPYESNWTQGGDPVIDKFLLGIHGVVPDGDVAQVCGRGAKKTPVEMMSANGLLNSRTIAAHCVQLSASDIQTLAASGASVAHCPRSNSRLRNGVSPLGQLLDARVNVGFGTDSAASTEDLSLLQEARFAWNLHRAVNPSFRHPAQQAISMLTVDAAKAIGMSHLLGTLEAGKFADMAIFGLDNAGEFLSQCPYEALMYGSVKLDSVFIGGVQC